MSSYPQAPIQGREQSAHVPFVRAVRAHPVLVAAVMIVAVAATIIYQKSRTPTYESTAQVLVTPVSSSGPYTGLPVVTESAADPARTLQTATSVLESPTAELATARQLGGSWTRKSVHEAVSIQPRGESNIVSITGSASSAAKAATLANAYAHNALTVRSSQLSNEAKADVEQLQARQKSLPAGETASAAQIAAQITALSSVAGGHDPNFSLLQAAIPPTSRSGSSLKLLAVLALLAGAVIGVGSATAIEYLNRRVRDEDEVLSLYPLPVLSRVAPLPRGTREATSFEQIPPRVRESFRTLQFQLSPGSAGRGRAIMFTSPSPRDGKTSSAMNFALTLTAAHAKVILFDFDLRKPDVGERLGIRSDYLDFFRSHAELGELLVEVRSAPGLRVISSSPQGEVTPLLEALGRRLPELMDTARELADYVIVDTPPIGQVSDALRAAVAVDDIVLVVRPGNTNREELKHTRELLDRMSHTPTGLLMIGESGTGDVYATYGAGEEQAESRNGSRGGGALPPASTRERAARSASSLERPKPGS